MFRRFMLLLLAAVFAFSIAVPGWTQDEEDPPATPPAATAPKGEATEGDATARYNALFEEWKTVLKDLRKLKSDYTSAKPDDADALEEQWVGLVAKGKELLPRLRDAGKAAYSDGKAIDPQLQRFLIKLAGDAAETDDYEIAYDLATTMLARSEQDQAPPPKDLYGIAGVGAFMTNRYDEAEKLLEKAKEAGALGGKAGNLVEEVGKYQKYWEVEQKAREADEQAELPRVKVSTTAGDMVVELFEDQAPDTVGNFVSLVEAGFYDGLVFHRVLPAFMAQGGDPQGTGQGGPGYKIYCETDKPDYRRHFRGTLSMAHAGKDTGGSQFFLCFTPQEGLDGLHTGFGRVIEGFETLAKIQRIDPEKPTPGIEKTKITKMEMIRKRDHKYQPRKVE